MDINKTIKLASQYHQQGNLQQAELIYKKILKSIPRNFHILNFLGNVLQEQHKDDEAIGCYQKAIQFNPTFAGSYFHLGSVFEKTGELEKAIYYYQEAIKYDSNFVGSYNNLGNVFRKIEQEDKAIPYFEKAIEINPNFWGSYYNLGEILQNKGQIDEAISLFQQTLQINPKHIASLNNLGNCLRDNGEIDEAIICYQKAIEINPNFAQSFNNLGVAMHEQYHLDEAISCFQKAIQLNPNYFEAYNNMGSIYIVQGKLNEGTICFKKALQLNPTYPKALFNLVGNRGLSYDDSKELFKQTKELITQDISKNESIDVYFTMGKLCDNLQMFNESFEYYRLGNMLKRAQVEYNTDAHIDYLSRIKKTFSADFIEHRKSWRSNSEMPIFIFGMPRSGTTLVEQILASHPNVNGGGELQFFNQIDQNLASILKVNDLYPECLNFVDDQTAYDIAELYLTKTREIVGLSKAYKRFTDKNPFNFYYLGLISLLFPKASFIHCQRHPLDTCISIYYQNFSHGNDFAYDLIELGQYYLGYLKIMNHWRKVLPIRIFELRYEDIVQQQTEVSRKLVEFCGMEWDSACLDFYKKDRPVYTASNWQVRQPIYTTSCGRWQNYEQFLDPLKELLTDFI